VILLLSSPGVSAQQDAGEFAKALNRIVASAKDGFKSVRGEVYSKDDKGNASSWQSAVALPGASRVSVHPDFVHVTFPAPETADRTRQLHQNIVRLVRAALPYTTWKQADGRLHTYASTGSERYSVRFQHLPDASVRISVIYRIASSGKGRVIMLIGGREDE
jgi:hypothetical protein